MREPFTYYNVVVRDKAGNIIDLMQETQDFDVALAWAQNAMAMMYGDQTVEFTKEVF